MIRLFLVGCPRSGTTLLQSLLAAHSQILSFPETHFFSRVLSPRPLLRKLGLASPHARTRFRRVLETIGHPDTPTNLPRFTISRHYYCRAFVAVLDALTRSQNKQAWLEKTPRHLHHVDEIGARVPGAKFIHLVRKGEDVIASLYEVVNAYPEIWTTMRAGDLNSCIARWIESIERSKPYLAAPDHAMVRYEQLIEAPHDVLSRLCQFIGVSFEERMLEDARHHAAALVLPHETWKQGVSQAIDIVSQRKFDRIFSDAERRHITARIAQVNLAEFN
jgi:hypothetical protein